MQHGVANHAQSKQLNCLAHGTSTIVWAHITKELKQKPFPGSDEYF